MRDRCGKRFNCRSWVALDRDGQSSEQEIIPSFDWYQQLPASIDSGYCSAGLVFGVGFANVNTVNKCDYAQLLKVFN
jgi:hypothetical protein